jgi:hypothetical protein
MEYFATRRPEAGPHRVALRLGPLEVEIAGLDDALAEMLFGRYSPYATRGAEDPDALRIRLGLDEVEFFLDPPDEVEFQQVRIACDGDRVRYLSYQIAGWFDVSGGEGELLLARGVWEPKLRAFENYVRAAVAWQAAGRRGALVHAASAVWQGKGYLFYGESGAGKSTLSACNRRAQVLSDDLSLVLPGGEGELEVVGSPFRGTYEGGPPVLGRFPLSAGFRLIQAPRAEVRPVPRTRAFAELVGNLPFVAEAFSTRDDLFRHTLESFASLPLAHLHFTKDDTYWDAIAAAGY